ncbi:MAG: MarR family transcriptional regulator [Gaiellales bacterium]
MPQSNQVTTATPVVDATDSANAWRHMLQLAASFEQFIGQLRGALGLSSNEMNALLMLWQGGSCSMTELADRIALSRPAVTTLIDRLEAAEYAARSHDKRDRRQVLVGITDKFSSDLEKHAFPYRDQLRRHAAASDTWEIFLEHTREVGRIASTSARELRDGARATELPSIRRPDQ